MTPMIDVIFLLLTFFIYAMVLMVRAYLLPVQLPGISQATAAPADIKAVSISLDSQGDLYLDAKLFNDVDAMIQQVKKIRAENPNARIYVAADIHGKKDRLPAFINLINQLRVSGLQEFYIVGNPTDDSSSIGK